MSDAEWRASRDMIWHVAIGTITPDDPLHILIEDGRYIVRKDGGERLSTPMDNLDAAKFVYLTLRGTYS